MTLIRINLSAVERYSSHVEDLRLAAERVETGPTVENPVISDFANKYSHYFPGHELTEHEKDTANVVARTAGSFKGTFSQLRKDFIVTMLSIDNTVQFDHEFQRIATMLGDQPYAITSAIGRGVVTFGSSLFFGATRHDRRGESGAIEVILDKVSKFYAGSDSSRTLLAAYLKKKGYTGKQIAAIEKLLKDAARGEGQFADLFKAASRGAAELDKFLKTPAGKAASRTLGTLDHLLTAYNTIQDIGYARESASRFYHSTNNLDSAQAAVDIAYDVFALTEDAGTIGKSKHAFLIGRFGTTSLRTGEAMGNEYTSKLAELERARQAPIDTQHEIAGAAAVRAQADGTYASIGQSDDHH